MIQIKLLPTSNIYCTCVINFSYFLTGSSRASFILLHRVIVLAAVDLLLIILIECHRSQFLHWGRVWWTRDKWFWRYKMKCYLPVNPSLRDKNFFAIRVNWLITHHSKLNTYVRIHLIFYSHLVKNNQN